MPAVRIYTRQFCWYCSAALRLLKQKGVEFERIDVSGDHQTRAWLREVTGQHTVPQIFLGEESIGGYTELAALDRSGELDERLARLTG